MSPDELARRRGPWIPAIHQALFQGVEEGAFPGGACAVYLDGELAHLSATGAACQGSESVPARADTLYDLASLTKMLVTTCLVAALRAKETLELDELVVKRLPAFGRGGKHQVTVRDLLAHRAGLPAWRPFFQLAQADPGSAALFGSARPPPSACRRGKAVVAEAVLGEPLERAPRTAMVYSDLGFITLGLLLEAAGGAPLDTLAREVLYRPLGLGSISFRPICGRPPRKDAVIAATGLVRPRAPAPGQEALYSAGGPSPMVGTVDDDNAFAMGGVAGHAGLFGHAADVARLGALLLEDFQGAGRIAPSAVWEELLQMDETPGSTRAVGFDTPHSDGAGLGSLLGKGARGAVGHLGFTGTSLWLDRDRQLAVVLLTNRVFPSRANLAIRGFRPRFHDAVARALPEVSR